MHIRRVLPRMTCFYCFHAPCPRHSHGGGTPFFLLVCGIITITIINPRTLVIFAGCATGDITGGYPAGISVRAGGLYTCFFVCWTCFTGYQRKIISRLARRVYRANQGAIGICAVDKSKQNQSHYNNDFL